MEWETKLIHAGLELDEHYGALSVPVYHTSTIGSALWRILDAMSTAGRVIRRAMRWRRLSLNWREEQRALLLPQE